VARLIRLTSGTDSASAAAYQTGIAEAASIIRAGGLVGFPTETVYGLAADGLNANAVAKVYAVKERPLDSALILHLADARDAASYAYELPPGAVELMDAFWPGPLTLVVPKASHVPEITSGGRDNIGLRVPDHHVARDLVRAAGVAVVGPSANLSGRPSPMTAADVLDELGDRIDAVLDAGATSLGIESTVLDLTASPPTVLRLGSITPEALERCLGRPVRLPSPTRMASLSPTRGLRFRLIVVDGADRESITRAAVRLALHAANAGCQVALLAQDGLVADAPDDVAVVSLGPTGDFIAAAARLYPALRACEAAGYSAVFVPAIPRVGLGLAVMHRLDKLAAEVVRV
jgi:L-threonylcarbamoyladenylate synthase